MWEQTGLLRESMGLVLMVLPQFTSGTRDVDVSGIISVYTIPPLCSPPSVIWDINIGNIQENTTPNLRETKYLNSPIERNLTKDPISPSISSQILGD